MEQENLSPRYRRPGELGRVAAPEAGRGRTASGGHCERQSTEAGHRGGTAHSSGEGSVIGPEPKNRGDQGQPGGNPQGEEPKVRPEPEVKSLEFAKGHIVAAWEKVCATYRA